MQPDELSRATEIDQAEPEATGPPPAVPEQPAPPPDVTCKQPSLKLEGGYLRPRTEKLVVSDATRPSSSTASSGRWAPIQTIVGDEMPVTGVLCFIEADWPLIGGAFANRGVEVLWPKKLDRRIRATLG